MAGVAYRFIALTPEQHDTLLARLKAPDTRGSERKRITALLMSYSGSTLGQIQHSKVLAEAALTRLFARFETLGVEAVTEHARPGRQRHVTSEMDTWILAQVRGDDRIWTASSLSEGLEQHFGVVIPPKSLVRHLHRLGLSWQRTRYVVSGTPDPAHLEQVQAGLPTLKRGHSRGSVSSI